MERATRMIGKGYWVLNSYFTEISVNQYTGYVARRVSHSGSIKPLDSTTPHEAIETTGKYNTPRVAGWARPKAQKVIVAEGNKCRIWTPATGEFSEVLDRKTALELVS